MREFWQITSSLADFSDEEECVEHGVEARENGSCHAHGWVAARRAVRFSSDSTSWANWAGCSGWPLASICFGDAIHVEISADDRCGDDNDCRHMGLHPKLVGVA